MPARSFRGAMDTLEANALSIHFHYDIKWTNRDLERPLHCDEKRRGRLCCCQIGAQSYLAANASLGSRGFFGCGLWMVKTS